MGTGSNLFPFLFQLIFAKKSFFTMTFVPIICIIHVYILLILNL